MKIFISGIDTGVSGTHISQIDKMKWNLVSYYYMRKHDDLFNELKDRSETMIIDSGAHSFQKGKKVEWLQYTKDYAEWIVKNDSNKILGYFEMDIDNIIGYEKVLELRKILEGVSDKIIPVWHKNRGINNYKKMCQKYTGKIIGITGFSNEDIKDDQYPMFVNMAWHYGCRIHCLGMTRKKILDKVPFDYTDSASWLSPLIYGRYNKELKIKKGNTNKQRGELIKLLYINALKMQLY